MRVPQSSFEQAARTLRDAGARFMTIFRAQTPEPALVAAFSLRGELVVLRSPTPDGDRLAYGSIGSWWPAAQWSEQELFERHGGVQVAEHPQRRLTAPDADLLDRRVGGLDVFCLPYGPVRSGVFEAIQFQIETGGEDVPRIQTRPFFKHRGIERRFEG
ncbi:MAG: NADH-quinone oxidoreductase subunit C, partial [Actinobacteria bacterium]|nr:NADH-quinone oxidoreductase subunit C [Actinomycetota bacterium]